MKALFLDIDGVLVTLESFQKYKKSGISAQASPPCVEQLNRILRETGAEIVLSSTWRMFGFDVMQQKFREWGIERPILDFTPELRRKQQGNAIFEAVTRGSEIESWLAIHGTCRTFTIVDDENDMGALLPHLVQTDFATGLTATLADEVIRRLA